MLCTKDACPFFFINRIVSLNVSENNNVETVASREFNADNTRRHEWRPKGIR